jgi:hypothetical protein
MRLGKRERARLAPQREAKLALRAKIWRVEAAQPGVANVLCQTIPIAIPASYRPSLKWEWDWIAARRIDNG